MKNKKNSTGPFPSILIRVLLIVTVTVLLSSVIVSIVFSSLGSSAFLKLEVNNMQDRAEYIATLTASFLEKRMTDDRFLYLVGDDSKLSHSSIYIYNSQGQLVSRNEQDSKRPNTKTVEKYLDRVLAGERVQDTGGIMVGVPVMSGFNNVIGAVFIVKPTSVVAESMKAIQAALRAASIMALLLMVVPVYVIVSYTIEQPIRRMTAAAENMADGHYEKLDDIRGRGELAVLGKSLNRLSDSLTENIGTLITERNLLNAILSGMEDGVITFDLSNRMVQHNGAASRLLGVGDSIPYDNDVMRTVIDHAHELGADRPYFDFNTTCENRILHIRMTLMHTDSDTDYVLVLMHDITEFARYEQSRKDYVANVSHELRTPIANIKRISEALCDGVVTGEAVQKYYSHLYNESDRLSRLINDLLELSRMQSGKLNISKRRTDLYDIIMDVSDRFARTAEENGVTIQIDCPENIPAVYTNEDRIEQVLIILIDNAMKHSASDTVEILARRINATQISVSVRNKGEINPDDLPHLFERFFKADRSHTGEGSGLGLSIASEIMSLLNEKIWVTSENGVVTFSFTLAVFRE